MQNSYENKWPKKPQKHVFEDGPKFKKNAIRKVLAGLSVIFFIFAFALSAQGCSNKIPVKLYFAVYEDDSAYLGTETRNIADGGSLYANIIEELIKGPESGQLMATLPPDAKVNSVTVSGGIAIVDFSREIITSTDIIPHSSTTEILAIFSIVDTLTEFKEIQKVRITVEGKQEGELNGLYIEDFWGHVGIYEDFERNEQVIGTGN